MFNVIPPMQFSLQKNTPITNGRSSFSQSNVTPLKADKTSFTGVEQIEFAKVCGKFLDSDLSLSGVKLSKQLKTALPEDYMHVLSKEVSEVIAKRLDFNSIVKNAEAGSFSHPPHLKKYLGFTFKSKEPSTFTFHVKKNHAKRYSIDWTEQYNALEKVFDDTAKKINSEVTKYDFKAAKDKLYAELKKLGLM